MGIGQVAHMQVETEEDNTPPLVLRRRSTPLCYASWPRQPVWSHCGHERLALATAVTGICGLNQSCRRSQASKANYCACAALESRAAGSGAIPGATGPRRRKFSLPVDVKHLERTKNGPQRESERAFENWDPLLFALSLATPGLRYTAHSPPEEAA